MTRVALLFLLLVPASVSLWACVPDSRVEGSETLTPREFEIIRVAMPQFERRVGNKVGYGVSIYETSSELQVLFMVPQSPTIRGSAYPDRPGLHVHLDKHTRRILSSNFMR